MAILGKRVREHFPRLADFVRSLLPEVENRRRTWNAFLEWSELSERLARMALMRDTGPYVGVTSVGSFNGVFRPDTPRVVFLHVKVARLFETRVRGSRLLVESTLLHELVRWGNYVGKYSLDSRELHNKQRADGKKRGGYAKAGGELREVGKQFERQAYGRDVNYGDNPSVAAK